MRGIRKSNQYPKKGGTFVITRVGEEGQILEPPEYISKFCNAIRALVRDQLNPAIYFWSGKHGVPKAKKQELWDKWLMNTFRIPAGTYELVKRHATGGRSFRGSKETENEKFEAMFEAIDICKECGFLRPC
jgi:hypothetical protein